MKDTVRQIFTEYLTANGHRKTPERYAILETIYSIDGHFDIDMLYSRMMDQENFRVSRATLYNTIILLINARLIINGTNLMKLVNGKLDPVLAFTTGKLKVDGDTNAAMELIRFLK